MLNGMDLFTGIAGISLALRDWVKPVAYCEIDTYCQGVILSRISDGSLHNAPIWDDIKTLSYDGRNWPGIDIIYGGFPCQDISVAGNGKGLAGERSGLFFEILRLAKEVKPSFIFLENTKGILSRGGLQIINSIESLGYDCRFKVFSADEFIDQKRERWFCLAKFNGKRRIEGASENIRQKIKTIVPEKSCNYKLSNMESWGTYARGLRKDSRIPFRMDRVKSLGNSVCVEQTKEAFKILMGLK